MKIGRLGAFIVAGILSLASIAAWVAQSYHRSTPQTVLWQTPFLDLKGNLQRIARPDRRPLVVNFWASWCAPCREEMRDFAELAHALQGKVDFIGIAMDNKEAVQQFLTTIPIPYPILLGQSDTIALMKAEGNRSGGLPFTAIYNANGSMFITKSGRIPKEAFKKLLYDLIMASSIH